jgi:uncharacterized protein (DUF2147 family)
MALWGQSLPMGKFFLLAHLCLPYLIASGASPAGIWRTFDDRTHKERGLVRVFELNGAFFGQITASFDPEEAREVCSKCAGARKDKPVIGLIVMWDMRKHGEEYSGGDILDPDTGDIYRCRMALEDNGKKLVVRGYIGFSLFGRSQTWLRQK